jgi:hypothetical protein
MPQYPRGSFFGQKGVGKSLKSGFLCKKRIKITFHIENIEKKSDK